MKRNVFARSAISLMALCGAAATAHAGVVVTPNALDGVDAYEGQASIFGNGSNDSNMFQTAVAGSQFAGESTGEVITAIGFRLQYNLGTVTDDAVYNDFTIRLGEPVGGVNGLTTDENGNLGADTIVARSGALTIPGGSFADAPGANPFYLIQLSTPYVYQGGDLLVTTSYATDFNAIPLISVDAIDPFGVVNTVGGTDPAFLHTHFYNAPVMEFIFGSVSAAPEPGAWAFMIGGIGFAGLALRRRRTSVVLA